MTGAPCPGGDHQVALDALRARRLALRQFALGDTVRPVAKVFQRRAAEGTGLPRHFLAGEPGLQTPDPGFPPEVTIGLHVADHGLDGGASAQLAADCGGDAALLAGDEDLSALGFGAVAAIATIGIGAGDGNASDPLDLLDLAGQRVTVIGSTWPALHAENELAAGGLRVGGGDGDPHAELEARPGFPLADA